VPAGDASHQHRSQFNRGIIGRYPAWIQYLEVEALRRRRYLSSDLQIRLIFKTIVPRRMKN